MIKGLESFREEQPQQLSFECVPDEYCQDGEYSKISQEELAQAIAVAVMAAMTPLAQKAMELDNEINELRLITSGLSGLIFKEITKGHK